MRLFIMGFTQVFLVVVNTYFIANSYLVGIGVTSFAISFIWSHNVKKVAFGSERDRLIYALGATAGALVGYFIAKLIKSQI